MSLYDLLSKLNIDPFHLAASHGPQPIAYCISGFFITTRKVRRLSGPKVSTLPRLLFGPFAVGQKGLQVRSIFFARHHRQFQLHEAGLVQPSVQLAFGKT
jgi:hypothetical protein